MLQQFVKAYNTVYSAHGMAPAAVPDKKVLEIWTRMNDRRSRLRVGKVKFNIGQLVRISIEKLKFAIGSEKKYTDELFRILKFFRRTPPPVYELEDLNGTLIEGQFYVEELKPVRVTKRSVYKIKYSTNGIGTVFSNASFTGKGTGGNSTRWFLQPF